MQKTKQPSFDQRVKIYPMGKYQPTDSWLAKQAPHEALGQSEMHCENIHAGTEEIVIEW
jgi:hypothetical protein